MVRPTAGLKATYSQPHATTEWVNPSQQFPALEGVYERPALRGCHIVIRVAGLAMHLDL